MAAAALPQVTAPPIKWAPIKTNLADHPTKHHTGPHHCQVQPIQLHVKGESPATSQECDKILDPANGVKQWICGEPPIGSCPFQWTFPQGAHDLFATAVMTITSL